MLGYFFDEPQPKECQRGRDFSIINALTILSPFSSGSEEAFEAVKPFLPSNSNRNSFVTSPCVWTDPDRD